jgi:NAD(P)-dependent dehydrogenase (short-subunit alcohol dehydrogenase family)
VQLEGKRIVVTGAGRGIGATATEGLLARGAEVITVDIEGDVDHRCDVSNAGEVDELFGSVGPITGLLNNAGLLAERVPIDEIDIELWDRIFDVNVKGTFLCARAAARQMGPGGSIVNVASQTAFTGSHGFAHYVASKGAVVSLTRALANELGSRGIRANCVAPGFTPTPGSAHLGAYDPSRIPLGRVLDPTDLVGIFCFLLSDDSAFVSGQATLVNGGMVAH